MFPRRPNTDVTGDVAAHGTTQVGIPQDIERTSPLAPGFRVTLFPTFVNSLPNVRGFVT